MVYSRVKKAKLAKSSQRQDGAEVQILQETPSEEVIEIKQEEVPIVEGQPKKTTHMATDLLERVKRGVKDCLIQNLDIFA